MADLNSLMLRAVSDPDLRARIIADPAEAAKAEGLSASAIKDIKRISITRLKAQFERLDSLTNDLGGPLAAGHSRDWNDANIHDKDDHIHDKNHSALELGSELIHPAIDADTLTNALKDPVVLREFKANAKLRSLAESVLGRGL